MQLYSLTRADPGGGLGVRTPTPSFGGPPNFIKRQRTFRVCARICCMLVPESPPAFPKSCIRPAHFYYNQME